MGGFGGFLTIDAGRIIDEDVGGDNGRLYALDSVPEVPLSPIASLMARADHPRAAHRRGGTAGGHRVRRLHDPRAHRGRSPRSHLASSTTSSCRRTSPRSWRGRLHLVPGTRPFGLISVAGGIPTAEGARIFGYVDQAGVSFANGATVVSANRPTSAGGLIHELGAFLEVPPSLTEALTDPDLDTLEILLAAAALVPTLEGIQSLTLFAPDEALSPHWRPAWSTTCSYLRTPRSTHCSVPRGQRRPPFAHARGW